VDRVKHVFVVGYLLLNFDFIYQFNPVALAHLGERQTEVQSLNLEVLCSIHRSDKLQCPACPGSLQLLFGYSIITLEPALHASIFACMTPQCR
jgi:hypothetical protein